MDKTDWKLAFIITIVLLVVVVVALIVIVVVASIEYETLKNTILATFYNQNECLLDPTKCTYEVFPITQPTGFPEGTYIPSVALLGIQLNMNLSYLQENGGNLHVPTFLQFISFIQGCPSCSFPQGIKETSPIPFGYVLLDNTTQTLYICYRGAVTNTEWEYAFNFNQQLYTQTSIEFVSREGGPVACSPETKVHQGFYQLFLTMQNEMVTILSNNEESYNKIVVFGHSLGATIASLSAMYLRISYTSKPIYVYTFGKPRVGNIQYSDCVKRLLGRNDWRIENQDDLFVNLPLATTPDFNNPSKPYIYEQDGTLQTYQLNWASNTLNHNLNNYGYAVSNILPNRC